MFSVLSGFFAIWSVVAVGAVLAHVRVLGEESQLLLTRLSFFVGNPALMVTMMATADVRRVFALNLAVTLAATFTTGLLYLLLVRLVVRPAPDLGHRTIGAFCSSYVNAGNMGLPIAAYVLHDVTWIAPLILVQVGLLQPLGLAFLDVDAARRGGVASSWRRNLTMPVRNPMTLATLLGLALNLAHLRIPAVLATPLEMVGQIAVPTMLLAFGVSLRLGRLPGRGPDAPEVALVCALKLLAQPLLALLGARLVGLDATSTRAVMVLAGLPTAQNVFSHAVRYQRCTALARDVVFITSVGAIATVTVIASTVG